MTLVIDTNIIISSLLKQSTNRKILLLPYFNFILPEYAFEEINNHMDKIQKISKLAEDEIKILLSILLENIDIIPNKTIQPAIKKAKEIIGYIDIDDVPFVAAALTTLNNGIWTNDKHFKQIENIKIWDTKDILIYLRKFH